MVTQLLVMALATVALAYGVVLVRMAIRAGAARLWPEAMALGAVTNFFDTLGIGSFAPTTAWIRLRRLTPDDWIPMTLNAGHCLPTIVQALIFLTIVRVDAWLLVACIAAAGLGGAIGAPLVLRLPARAVQAVVGLALLIAAGLYAMSNLGLTPGGGVALALPAGLFFTAVAAHLLFGALMAGGVGLYAPSLITLSLMGMDPKACFPIMMGACGAMMPISGFRFLRSARLDLRLVLGVAIGGIPAVFAAAFLVKSLPLNTLRWGVVVVVLYTAASMLITAGRGAQKIGA